MPWGLMRIKSASSRLVTLRIIVEYSTLYTYMWNLWNFKWSIIIAFKTNVVAIKPFIFLPLISLQFELYYKFTFKQPWSHTNTNIVVVSQIQIDFLEYFL